MARIKRLAPYFLVGPISGPLLAGAVRNFQSGRPVLAIMYMVALVECAIALPLLVTKLGVNVLT
ncbi:hypothetical protein ABENE_15185 [Asticcacaulis benevestitus DSM 16100 = ATCC BAA-896]|uniref:Uncharacterized protein n=1 Tax=Asticcacaulis benevestitus DSM 16100 = ATCC BAA-896 TaxID=1121022 RepID=V4PKT6_9CAUL|nr:hypothetical protein ABENE_15185 [Asticcacaulis benevestitus DSM 16100 = ATCC BAA-896]